MDVFDRLNGNINLLQIQEILTKQKDINYEILGECNSILHKETLFLFADEKSKEKVWLTSQECCRLSDHFGITFFDDLMEEYFKNYP